MIQLGYASAILPDLSLEEVVQFTAENGFSTVELMCWPAGKAERRYAGVTHIDVVGFTAADAARVNDLAASAGITISGLGYYPNPLTPDQDEAQVAIDHIKRVIEAFGLNYDPSHMIWQHMDYLKPIRDFTDKLFHVHAKDVRLDKHRLDEVGIMATPLEFHVPKLPGLGDIDWGQFFSVLSDVGYDGPVCIEVEDRAYEDSLESRKASLVQSGRYLKNFMP
ncbi:MAG: sugar phosphate isomerase/epimerase [Caldilineaceae bacterium]|nr:sugar phosphate isomerase/epimerase [Caldilineaceae bacterium]